MLAGAGRLSQVFLNLLINAAHAIDEGSASDNEIRVHTWAEAGQACAEVRDTGKGIDAQHVEKIFEPFFTTKQVGSGSGLGLAISKNIIESYGGTITAQGGAGRGASFIVRLPIMGALDDMVADEAPISTRVPVVRGRVLVVDDESGIRAGMVRMLAAHEVVEATGGAAAKRLLEADDAFDMILCDMMMPEVSGLDLHAWLRERSPGLAKQLVFVTGGAFTPRAREYLASVENITLEKPIDAKKLKKTVEEFIRVSKRLGEEGR